MKKILLGAKCLMSAALIACSVATTTPALADTRIEAYPSAWLLQDYLNGDIALYYTGSTCVSGQLILGGNVPAESRARFWSMLLTAVASNRKVGVYYSSGCYITNFYLLPS